MRTNERKLRKVIREEVQNILTETLYSDNTEDIDQVNSFFQGKAVSSIKNPFEIPGEFQIHFEDGSTLKVNTDDSGRIRLHA